MSTDELTLSYGPLTIGYDGSVLEPRPWTVAQARWAAELAAELPAGPVLELCSGAGHIGLLTARLTVRRLVCVDLSPTACAWTRRNAAAAGLADRVEVREAALDDAVGPEERFPLVVADPPWVTSDSVDTFPEDPVLAIDGGADGLDVARTCVTVAAHHLQPGGALLLQLGDRRQAAVLDEHLPVRLHTEEVRQEERGVLMLARAEGPPQSGR